MEKDIRNELNQHANVIGEIRLETAELKKNLIRLSDLVESNKNDAPPALEESIWH